MAFDRILARLVHVAPDVWLLKGGVALEYRLQHSRATADVDISAKLAFAGMQEVLEHAAAAEMADYFAMRVVQISKPIDDIDTYRFRLDVVFATGRLFEPMNLDVGFADPWLGTPQALTAPSLLEFAGIRPTTVYAIPASQHIAEKLHAYTRGYGADRLRPSTRVKDLIDLALLLQSDAPEPEELATTIRDVFTARTSHAIPKRLPQPPTSWSAGYPALAGDLPIPKTSREAFEYVRDVLDPILQAIG